MAQTTDSPNNPPDAHGRRLLARIHREFETAEEDVPVGTRKMRFTRVRDPDAVLDSVCQQETDRQRGIQPKRTLRMPYWAAVWESALALANYLAERSAIESLAGKRTLDLGCGMGMAGAAMALLGAQVTLADIETACLLFARLNTLPWEDRCRVTRCDWQQDDLGERYDVIVGADVLYEVDQWPFIEKFLRKHLAEGGVAIIGEPVRPKAEVFPEWLCARGWQLSASQASAGGRTINVYKARVSAIAGYEKNRI
jgi:predicted nicotinamide N-methyase